MMKASLLVSSLLCGLSGAALADSPGPDWITREALIQKLAGEGYQSIVDLEADDGHWEGEAVRDGKIVEFHADPRTGKILSEKLKH